MQSFTWKRKRGGISKFSTEAFKHEDEADHADEEVDWLTAAKKPKILVLEDSLAKAERLKKEGVILAESCKWWSAIRQWGAAVALQPSDHTLHEMMSQAYMQVGELVASITSGELAVQSAPLWWCGHQTLGRALLGVGELHRAVLCFSCALRLNPDMDELREQDLQWAFTLLKKYRQLQKSKENSSNASKPTEKTAPKSEKECEETLQIVDLQENPEGFPPSPPSPCSSCPSVSARGQGRSSITDTVQFVSCCSSNKSGQRSSQHNDDINTNSLDISKMVCMRPSLPNR